LGDRLKSALPRGHSDGPVEKKREEREVCLRRASLRGGCNTDVSWGKTVRLSKVNIKVGARKPKRSSSKEGNKKREFDERFIEGGSRSGPAKTRRGEPF